MEKKILNKNPEISITEIINKNLIPTTLQVDDYIPFITITGINRNKEIHNYCDNKYFLFVCKKNMNNIIEIQKYLLDKIQEFNIIFVSQQSVDNTKLLNNSILYTIDEQLNKLLSIDDEIKVYIVSPNRRIKKILYIFDLSDLSRIKCEDYMDNNSNIPYIIIENALDEELLQKVIAFYNNGKKNGKLTEHRHDTKDRLHIHPDAQLEKEIDNKLSRSVFPELRKVFYFDVKYRETYKICSYDAETSGRFHMHRDTPAPFQHRKFALSLLLNDDYEGGELFLPEYGIKIKPKANTAIIFPGISTHQVLEVTKGSRMTIISFFVNGDLKPHYKMKSHFFDERDIKYSNIYPL